MADVRSARERVNATVRDDARDGADVEVRRRRRTATMTRRTATRGDPRAREDRARGRRGRRARGAFATRKGGWMVCDDAWARARARRGTRA